MHERYFESERERERERGRNGNRSRGASGRDAYEQDDFRRYEERDDDEPRYGRDYGARDWERERNREGGRFGRESFEGPRGRTGRSEAPRNPQSFGGESEWRDRFGGSDWEQPRYAGGDFESSRRPFAGGHGGYGERSAPGHRYDEDRSFGSRDREPGFGSQQGFGAQRGFDKPFGPAGPYGEESGQGTWGGFSRQPQQGSHAGKGPKGYQRADDRILEDVNQALERHPQIDASEIEVSCQKGEIVLRGAVDDRNAKRLAEQCIEDLPGVKDVRNELRVQRQQQEQQGQQSGQQASRRDKSGESLTRN